MQGPEFCWNVKGLVIGFALIALLLLGSTQALASTQESPTAYGAGEGSPPATQTCEDQELERIEDGIARVGSWTNSQCRLSVSRRYVDLYSFHIDSDASVIIELVSHDADPYLYLHKLQRKPFVFWQWEWRTVASDDDGRPKEGYWRTRDSRLTVELTPGDYRIWATTYSARDTGRYLLSIHSGDGRSVHPNILSLSDVSSDMTPRETERHLGSWFYQALFGLSSEEMADVPSYLIGYNEFENKGSDNYCKDKHRPGGKIHHGWDSQTYEASPPGRENYSDWRARSYGSVFSLTAGQVFYVDSAKGTIGIYDGEKSVYYAHLNEVAERIAHATLERRVTVLAGEYLGREGARGQAHGPHVHLEVREGLPASGSAMHNLCAQDGSALPPLPYLHGLLSRGP